jgi:7-cyano-7-deazaguanine synthase
MKIIVVISGGLDSVTLAYHLKEQGHDLSLLTVDYGQRHKKEIVCAVIAAIRLGAIHRQVDLSTLKPLMAGSALMDGSVPVPHGHYAAESMKATVVPNRNMLILATAAAWAISIKADAVAIGAHAGDHAVYPDCRPEFAAAMDHALSLCDWHPVRVERPFIAMTKADIVTLGHSLGVPFADTWSCYEGGDVHCGRCGTCVERAGAFIDADVPDPTVYRDKEYARSLLAADVSG